MSEQINPDRRRLLGTAAMTIAALALASIALSKRHGDRTPTVSVDPPAEAHR